MATRLAQLASSAKLAGPAVAFAPADTPKIRISRRQRARSMSRRICRRAPAWGMLRARSRAVGPHVLIDYFWPFAGYRNADVGTKLERAAAYRYNRERARGLPAYLNRWLALSCLLLSASSVSSGWLVAVTGTAFTLAFCMTLHIGHVWLMLNRGGYLRHRR